MSKLSELLEESNRLGPNLHGLNAAVSGFGLNSQIVVAHQRFIAGVLGFATLGAVGLINLSVGQELDLRSVYIVICVGLGWFAGMPAAVASALVSSTLMAFVQKSSWYAAPSMFTINLALHFSGTLVLAWAAAKLGVEVSNLQCRVGQGTASLEKAAREHEETSDLLEEAIQLFLQVTDNIADVFWVTDPAKTKVEYVSPGFELVFGKTCQSLLSSPNAWFDSIHHEDRQRVTRAMFAKQIRGDYDEEYRLVRPDGSLRWVHDRAFPVKDEVGAVFRLVGITEDITERKRAEQLMQAERDIGAALSSTNDLKFAMDRLLEIALQLEGIDCGGVYLADPDTGALRLDSHRGLSGAFVRRIAQYKPDTIDAQLSRKAEATYLRREFIPRSLEALWGSEGLRALAIVPVQHKGSVQGMLNLGSYSHDEILPRTRAGIEMIAAQVAGAIARIRAEEAQRHLERQILEISDREQARFGQDLHDGLCQLLIGMAFRLNSLEQALSSEEHQEATSTRKICALLNEAIEESRRVARGLYPIRLSTQGLIPALEELVLGSSQRYSVDCACEFQQEPVSCDFATATHLYRIAQEAVNNSLKHASATRIRIIFAQTKQELTLEVRDNGKGLKPSTVRGSGMGMHIMNYRAQLISASLNVQSSEAGTVVSCRLSKTK